MGIHVHITLALLAAGCGADGPGGRTATGAVEVCTNLVDDDRDGLRDCADDECRPTCDADLDGAVAAALGGPDCDDGDPAVHPAALEVCDDEDDDCDGLVDDADPGRDPGSAKGWYRDGDADGAGAGEPVVRCDAPPDGVATGGDCDDGDPAIFPGGTEVCGGADEDCDGLVDDDDPDVDASATGSTFYADVDGDGAGDAAAPVVACVVPDGAVADATDCAPLDPAYRSEQTWWPDDDGDGAGDPAGASVLACAPPPGHVATADDCDDDDPSQVPGAIWHRDADGDGFGDPGYWVGQCARPAGYVPDGSDCDDADPVVNPDREAFADLDEDGFGDPLAPVPGCDLSSPSSPVALDCDDGDAWVYPDAPELCDGLDNDCDLDVDEEVVDDLPWYADADHDGWGNPLVVAFDCAPPPSYVGNALDCDDTDPAVSGADADGDGADVCEGDCDDLDPAEWPGASPACPVASCLELVGVLGGGADGAYWLSPAGAPAVSTWCDLTTDGGGWTLGFLRSSASTGSQAGFGGPGGPTTDLGVQPVAASASGVPALSWHDLESWDWTELRVAAYSSGAVSYTSRTIPRSELRIRFGENGFLLYGGAAGYYWCGGARSYTDAGINATNNPAGAPPDCKGHGALGTGWDFSESTAANVGLTLSGPDGNSWMHGTWAGAEISYGTAGAAQAIWVR